MKTSSEDEDERRLQDVFKTSSSRRMFAGRSASQLRREKTWLRTTMSRERLNLLMLLSTHKEKTDELDLIKVAHDFCEGNRDRFSSFGVFTEEDFPKISPVL